MYILGKHAGTNKHPDHLSPLTEKRPKKQKNPVQLLKLTKNTPRKITDILALVSRTFILQWLFWCYTSGPAIS